MVLEKMKKHILENLVSTDGEITIIPQHDNPFVTEVLVKNSTLWILDTN